MYSTGTFDGFKCGRYEAMCVPSCQIFPTGKVNYNVNGQIFTLTTDCCSSTNCNSNYNLATNATLCPPSSSSINVYDSFLSTINISNSACSLFETKLKLFFNLFILSLFLILN